MGEFFMPFPGTRINQETVPLNAGGMSGVASYYEVKFTDTNKPNGQIWAGVVGAPTPRGHAARPARARALVRGLAWHRQQPGARRRGDHAGAVDPAVDAAASAAAGSQRPAATPPAGGTNAPGSEPQRRRAGSGRPEQRSTRDAAAVLTANGRLGFQGPTYGCWPSRLLTLSQEAVGAAEPHGARGHAALKRSVPGDRSVACGAAAPWRPPALATGARRSRQRDAAGYKSADRQCDKCFHHSPLPPYRAVTGTSP